MRKFKFGVGEIEDQVGAVTGLAWTEVGGELLTIEAVTSAGKGTIKTTGKLGDVMTESIATALSFVKARSIAYGIKPSVFEKKEIHVHVPEGATPKDGPSAGVAMVTAIVSTLTGIAVRKDIAMTGEVTLRGRVLPIGGLEGEAARRAAGRHHHGADPDREREGPRRNPGEREGRADDHSRRARRPGTRTRAGRRRWCRSSGPRPTTSPRGPIR